jgi:hypothetical protein
MAPVFSLVEPAPIALGRDIAARLFGDASSNVPG